MSPINELRLLLTSSRRELDIYRVENVDYSKIGASESELHKLICSISIFDFALDEFEAELAKTSSIGVVAMSVLKKKWVELKSAIAARLDKCSDVSPSRNSHT